MDAKCFKVVYKKKKTKPVVFFLAQRQDPVWRLHIDFI